MTNHWFADTIESEPALRELLGEPGDLAIRKQLSALDEHCRAFIARSPLVLVGSVGAEGRHDVSPRGDEPGFVLVLDDHTLVIPERPGNRRADTLLNILRTASIGLLFLVPGVEETLRVNGRACLVRDAAILDRAVVRGKRPLLAIGVEVEECYLHCAKAFKRSRLWDPATWPERSALPTLGRMLHDQIKPAGQAVADLDAGIEESYRTRLY